MAELSDEILMRFADGELDEATMERVAEALERDEALAERVAMFAGTRHTAHAAMAPMLDEPVPDALRRSVEDMVARHREAQEAPKVISLAERRERRRPSDWMGLAAAACLAAVLGGLTGYWLKGDQASSSTFQLGKVADAGLAQALSTQPSGREVALADARFRPIASFRDGDGGICREFELDRPQGSTVVSVACRSGQNWETRFAVAAPAGESSYAPASSTDAMEAYLQAIGGPAALSADEEKAALAALAN